MGNHEEFYGHIFSAAYRIGNTFSKSDIDSALIGTPFSVHLSNKDNIIKIYSLDNNPPKNHSESREIFRQFLTFLHTISGNSSAYQLTPQSFTIETVREMEATLHDLSTSELRDMTNLGFSLQLKLTPPKSKFPLQTKHLRRMRAKSIRLWIRLISPTHSIVEISRMLSALPDKSYRIDKSMRQDEDYGPSYVWSIGIETNKLTTNSLIRKTNKNFIKNHIGPILNHAEFSDKTLGLSVFCKSRFSDGTITLSRKNLQSILESQLDLSVMIVRTTDSA